MSPKPDRAATPSAVIVDMGGTLAMSHYDVLCVLDDRDLVVHMWHHWGLTCVQVAERDF